jgi:hypothetical protein
LDPSLIDLANKELQVLVLPDTTVPQYITPVETLEARPEDLRSLGLAQAEPEGQTEAVADAVADAILNANTNASSMPVNVVLRNTVQQQQPNQAFNYTIVGEPEPSSSIDAIDLNPFIQEQQQQQQQQPSVNINIQSQPQQQQRAPTNAILVPSAIPGAPPTLVVDTGPEEMQRSGFPPLEQQVQRQRQPSNGNQRRSPRNVGFAQPANNSPAVAASTVPATTKVNVIKQG